MNLDLVTVKLKKTKYFHRETGNAMHFECLKISGNEVINPILINHFSEREITLGVFDDTTTLLDSSNFKNLS